MASKKKDEEPVTDWLALAQPTEEQPAQPDSGPWWVEDSEGHKFATYRRADGLKVLNESPFDRNGNLRSPEPWSVTDAAEAVTEGESR